MTVDLHFVCQHGDHWTRLGDNRFETGNWTMTEETAKEAVGGRIYLHAAKRAPAWHGGTITGWRRSDDSRRLIFTYVVDGPFRLSLSAGWGQEKAIVAR